tara:strand:- start:2375 stop:4675 length:2301 start_codon:yes stop_codon:yes gene_type:complete
MLAVLWSSSALAQSASGDASDDDQVNDGNIVVTASRRETNLSDVPVSVTAFSQSSMDEQSIREIDDIARSTPGVNFGRGFGNGNSISIRGLGGSGASTTGIYIDDTPIHTRTLNFGAYNTYPLIFDLERVEVLRGPQGTLFGAGSEGGTLRFITPSPSLYDTSVYGRAELSAVRGGDVNYEGGVAYGTPIIDGKVGLRVSGWFQHRGGWIDRLDKPSGEIVDENINFTESKAVKVDLKIAPTERLTITPSFYFQERRIEDNGQIWDELSDVENGVFNTAIAVDQPATDRFKLFALKAEYDFDSFSIFSNTSYFDRYETANYDYSTLIPSYFVGLSFDDRFPNHQAFAYFLDRQKVFTQELRIQSNDGDSPFTWLVGGFYNHARQTAYEDIIDRDFDRLIETLRGVTVEQFFGQPVMSGDRIFTQDDSALDEQYAVFGEASYRFLDQLTVTVGGRYGKSEASLDNYATGPFNGGRTTSVSGEGSDTSFDPKVSVAWEPSMDTMIYATVSKGSRPGGVNQQIPYVDGICKEDLDRNGGPAPGAYGQDTVWSYEVGAKGSAAGGAVFFAGSAYYLQWKDKQQGRFACGLSYIDNSGEAISKGFDLSLNVRPAHGVSLGLAVAYTDAYFSQGIAVINDAGEEIVSIAEGDSLVSQPWTVVANAQYDFAIGSSDAYIRGDYQYQGGFSPGSAFNPNTTAYDVNAFKPIDTHFVTARAGVDLGAWDISLFVKNLFDDRTILNRFRDNRRVLGLTKVRIPEPRTIGLTATIRY